MVRRKPLGAAGTVAVAASHSPASVRLMLTGSGAPVPPVQSPWDGVREAQTLTVVFIILPAPLLVQDRGPQ